MPSLRGGYIIRGGAGIQTQAVWVQKSMLLKLHSYVFFFCADFPNILNTIPYANITNHTPQNQIESPPLHFANVGELCGSRKEGVHNKS